MSRRATWLMPLVLAAGCAGEAPGNLSISLNIEALTGPMADPGTPMAGEDGLVLLERFPTFVFLRVEAADLEAPLVATWPSEVPESTPDVVPLELEVPAGRDRQISLEVVYAQSAAVITTYTSPPPGGAASSVSIDAGQVTEVELTPTELQRGTAEVTCGGDPSVVAVSWVDDGLDVVYPPMDCVEGGFTIDLSVGRRYWPRATLEDGSVVDLTSDVIELARSGETQEITLPSE